VKIDSLNFYRGPNLWARVSGLHAGFVQVTPEGAGMVDRGDLSAFLELLAEAIPIAKESVQLASPDYLHTSASPEIGLVLAVCEIVSRDFCVEPQIGTVLADEGSGTCFVPCDDGPIAVASLELAVEIANAAPHFRVADPAQFREQFRNRYRDYRQKAIHHKLDQSTLGMVRTAAARGVPFSRVEGIGRMVRLGHGIHGRRVNETITDGLSSVGAKIAADKLMTGIFLDRFGIPNSATRPVASAADAVKAAKMLGYPLVVKPRTGRKGQGVTVDIRTEEQLLKAFDNAWRHGLGALVERFVPGDDHRLLVVGGRLVAAARRLPAQVVGDGVSSVRQLIDRANCDPMRGEFSFERPLEKIELDDEALDHLERAGMEPDSVPGDGVAVVLRGAANISRGGTAVDVTGIVHPDNRKAVERAARIIGAEVLGIDFLSPDIARSWREIPSAIIEANISPGLRPHQAANPAQDAFAPIVDLMFPEGNDGRVPIVGVTGSVGKTSTVSMIAAILARAGLVAARTTTEGAWIGDEPIKSGDCSFGGIGQTMLQDPAVEAGVFELARGALLKTGMVLDALDVGIVTGVLDNQIGIDGIETREDLARIKRLVVENARKLAVLNADDPLTLAMREHAGTERIALVSARPDNPEVLAHRDAGGLAAFLDKRDNLVVFDRGKPVGRIAMPDVPVCWNGSFRPAAVNALFAACAAHGLGIGFAIIADALKTFVSDLETNLGRNNYFENLPYRLLITHFDGPYPAFAVAQLAQTFEVGGSRRILFASPGNRPDYHITAIARNVAGAFDEYYCTDWTDLRGRAPGEVAAKLAETLREAGIDPVRIHEIASPQDAIRAAYDGLGPDDFIFDALIDPIADRTWLALRGLKRNGKQLTPQNPA